jgi:hypothetical protein
VLLGIDENEKAKKPSSRYCCAGLWVRQLRRGCCEAIIQKIHPSKNTPHPFQIIPYICKSNYIVITII